MTASSHPPGQPGKKTKSRVGLLGIGIGIVGLAFASYALATAWDEITDAEIALETLAIAAVFGIAGMWTIGLNWVRVIRLSGTSVRMTDGLRWYFVGQLGKYIPGGLWAVLGRGELATRGGVDRIVSYSSVAVSLATTYAAAAAVGALLLTFSASSLVSRLTWMALSAAIVVAAVLALSEPVARWLDKLAGRFGLETTLPSLESGMSLTTIILTMPAWLFIGSATALVGTAFGFEVEVGQVIAATSYSWLVGFLVVPMPGGLGVREAAFIALYPGPTEEAAAIAVASRILFILVDVTAAATATVTANLFGRIDR